ncbi:MAG: sulfur oxidation protein SoxY [Salinarimonadaceae bacterium]|nr:MAG: sulfur oxidation protein SoxY [Salinarimonadaceae bacterium]
MKFDRRAFITASAALVGVALLPKRFAWAELSDDVADALRAAIADREVVEGGIVLDAPDIAQNGASVPVGVFVESPMTAADHVREIRLFATRNPSPQIGAFRFTPASGRAEATTRIRLAEGQEIIVLAETSDGRLLRVSATVEVTVGGCVT